MNNNTINLTVAGLKKIMAEHDIEVRHEVLENNSILVIAERNRIVVYNEMIKEEDLHLNKEGVVYLVYREEYINARVTRFVYQKLMEKLIIPVRRSPIKKTAW